MISADRPLVWLALCQDKFEDEAPSSDVLPRLLLVPVPETLPEPTPGPTLTIQPLPWDKTKATGEAAWGRLLETAHLPEVSVKTA